MKILTINDIRAFEPCYDPIKYISEDWSGSVIDVIDLKQVPFEDKLWLILRNEFVSDKLMRLFAVWCYRQTLKFISNPDPRSIAAADTAERYANGLATDEELRLAESAARAAWSAAGLTWSGDAPAVQAWSAESAVQSARSVVAAVVAAVQSARSAAATAWSVAWSEVYSAADSKVAYSTARLAQEQKLREMLITGIETGDVK